MGLYVCPSRNRKWLWRSGRWGGMGGFRGRVSVWWVAEFSSLEGKEGRPKEGSLRNGWWATSGEGAQGLSQGREGV